MRASRTIAKVLLGGLAGVVGVGAPSLARAQSDTNPPLPNVMLLVDTSGSMEFLMGLDPVTKKPRLPVCNPGNPASEQNRWTTLSAVMTGEFPEYSCFAQSRSDPNFVAEYSIGGQAPYDKDYYLPYNRIISKDTTNTNELCVVGPDTTKWPVAGNPFPFPNDAIRTHLFNNRNTTCPAVSGTPGALLQAPDGILDVYRDQVRFGLMTFDGLPSQSTGYANNAHNAQLGFQGLWSYYPGWNTNANTFAKGKPELCATDQIIEVGARNPAAPPWEGRLIPFGDYAAPLADVQQQNDRIQRAITSLRPYGATPMAGLMADAEYFFTGDGSMDFNDPNNASKRFGPKDDPYVAGGCRKQFIILLTDGIPNLDLREGCKNNAPGPPNGTCPYKLPSQTAYDLSHPPDPKKKVKTFVVGFAFSTTDSGGPQPLDCKLLDGANLNAICNNPPNDGVKACCEMAKIAYNGDTGKPRFADDKPALRKAINDILSEVAQTTTSRTTPTFASAGGSAGYKGGNGTAAFNFLSSFKVASATLWQGVLERQRISCSFEQGKYVLKEENVEATAGDKFHENLASGTGLVRRFFTVEPGTQANGKVLAARSIRRVSITDGLDGPLAIDKNAPVNTFFSLPSPEALDIPVPNASQSACGTLKTPVDPVTCRNRIMRWETGLPPIDGSLYSRETTPLGSVYHSNPVTMGAPSEFLRDESYTLFAQQQKARPLVLYSATTDGQLHAFQVAPTSPSDPVQAKTKSNNELWSFMPPGVLPSIKGLYPGVQQRLLDSPIAVQDVVFKRSRTDAAGNASSVAWNTMLVSSFGPALGGYFAIDVTNPIFDSSKPTTTGPVFRWQLTADNDGDKLFGSSGTPLISTVFYKDPNVSEPQEIAVAILPGGDGAPLASQPAGGCARAVPGWQTVEGKWKARPNVRCYNTYDPGRSLTVVRLDTGEVVRRFHRCNGNTHPPYLPPELIARSTCAPFDSPVTGVPISYPSGTGQVATRAFVGDRDGGMWRLDMSDTNPANWKVNMFFDAYAHYPADPNIGQPVVISPVASLDPVGNLVVAFATGDQEQFNSSPGMRSVLWSVSETPDFTNNKVGSKANWHLGTGINEPISAQVANTASSNWNDGIRVSGPLSLFNGVVYFSTYNPPSAAANACDPGSSVLWGVDYLIGENVTPDGDTSPRKRLITDPNNPTTFYHAKAYTNSLIFGVGVQRLPTCFDLTTHSDNYLGFGSATSVANATPPEFRLVVQTGPSAPSNPTQSETKFEVLKLPPPSSGARISSWASVVE